MSGHRGCKDRARGCRETIICWELSSFLGPAAGRSLLPGRGGGEGAEGRGKDMCKAQVGWGHRGGVPREAQMLSHRMPAAECVLP